MPTFQDNTGFTLVELLVAMALALVIIASLSSTFVFQHKTYDVQQQVAEMNQNGRAAIDIMSRDIMMTGYGIANSNYDNLSSWIDWATVSFGTEPFVIQSGVGDSPESGGSDIIHIAGCFDDPVTTLTSSADKGNTTLSVSSGSDFSTGDMICINGLENAIVTNVSNSSLDIDTDPITSGDQGLVNDHDDIANVEIYVVKVISYSIVQDTDGSYVLKRNSDEGKGGSFQPLAENIVELNISQSGDTIEINSLTAQTDKADPNYSENNGHRRRSFQTYLTPPNLTF